MIDAAYGIAIGFIVGFVSAMLLLTEKRIDESYPDGDRVTDGVANDKDD